MSTASDSSQLLTVASIAAPLIFAVFTGLWAVWVRAQENDRAEWRRIQELTVIVYQGGEHGVWAQKLAVDELVTLRRRRAEISRFLREASAFFGSADDKVANDLALHIDGRLR